MNAEITDEVDDLASNGLVIEGGERVDKRRGEEMRVEREEGFQKGRLREGLRELGKSVGNVDSGGPRGGGEEVGNADEANGAALGHPEVEGGPVTPRARERLIHSFSWIVVFSIELLREVGELGIVEVHDGGVGAVLGLV